MAAENPREQLVKHILCNKYGLELMPYLLEHSISPPDPFYIKRTSEQTDIPIPTTYRLFNLLYWGEAIRYYSGKKNPLAYGQEGKNAILYERCGPPFWEGIALLIDYTRND